METFSLVGYLGSVIILISLTMSNIRKLRLINFLGAVTFATYGFLIQAWPVFVLNILTSSTNLYHLIHLYRKKDYFDFNDTLKGHEFFFHRFMNFFAADIKRFFPEFDFSSLKKPKIILVSRNMNPVGMFIYEELEEEGIQIHLDYVRKEYRDFKNARYLYLGDESFLSSRGHKKCIIQNSSKEHQQFLLKHHFTKVPGQENFFERQCV